MRYILALILPWFALLTVGRIFSAVLCFILQCTVLAWPLAALWAMLAVHDYHVQQRLERSARDLRRTLQRERDVVARQRADDSIDAAYLEGMLVASAHQC